MLQFRPVCEYVQKIVFAQQQQKKKKIQCFCNDTAIKPVIGFCFECAVRSIGHIVGGRIAHCTMHTQSLSPMGAQREKFHAIATV